MLFNAPRATQFMKECGLDALVATSAVNVTYFSEYYLWVDALFKEYMVNPGGSSNRFQLYAVFPASGEAALVLSPFVALNAADIWIKDLQVYGDAGLDFSRSSEPADSPYARFFDLTKNPSPHSTPTEALLAVLRSRGLADARIGLETEDLPAETLASIREGLPQASLKNCTNLIRLLRAVKTPDEIERQERAAAISEEAAIESAKLAAPGRRIKDLVECYRTRIAALGADFDHFAYGPRGLGMAAEPDYVLAAGDFMFMDFGCIFRRCVSDGGGTLVLGELPPDLRTIYDGLYASTESAGQAMRPGVKSSAVREIMKNEVDARGIKAPNPHGHGLGLEVRDYPMIMPDNGLRLRDECIDVPSDLPLEEGMVVNLEVNIFMANVGSLHVERTFVIEAHGCRSIVPQQRKEPWEIVSV
jgi:Xaa-Pro dipeptidase